MVVILFTVCRCIKSVETLLCTISGGGEGQFCKSVAKRRPSFCHRKEPGKGSGRLWDRRDSGAFDRGMHSSFPLSESELKTGYYGDADFAQYLLGTFCDPVVRFE